MLLQKAYRAMTGGFDYFTIQGTHYSLSNINDCWLLVSVIETSNKRDILGLSNMDISRQAREKLLEFLKERIDTL